MRKKIHFSDEERYQCWHVAKQNTDYLRTVDNQRYNVDQVLSGGDPYAKRYMAMLAEMAVAKFLELPFEIERKLQNEIGTPDGELNGCTYDVKASSYKAAWLYCPSYKTAHKSDLYITVYVPIKPYEKTKHVELVGWLWRNEICKPEFKTGKPNDRDFNRPFVVKDGFRSIDRLIEETWHAQQLLIKQKGMNNEKFS